MARNQDLDLFFLAVQRVLYIYQVDRVEAGDTGERGKEKKADARTIIEQKINMYNITTSISKK